MRDPIVEEIRKFREEHAKLFGNNIDEICKDLYQHQIECGHHLVRFKPKKILDMSSGWGDRLMAATMFDPKLYVGIGVSGAVQHLVGMQGSEKVVAINVDRNAPMAQIADYSIIGDYLKVVPELIKGLKARSLTIKPEGAK